MNSSNDFTLILEIQRSILRATLENRSNGTLRIWRQTNSWGWRTFILIINTHEIADVQYTLIAMPRIWTRNGPVPIDIEPGETQCFEVSFGEPEWDDMKKIEHLKEKPFHVRAAIRIPETPEAIELGVFIGQITSSPELSQPPHAWLFSYGQE